MDRITKPFRHEYMHNLSVPSTGNETPSTINLTRRRSISTMEESIPLYLYLYGRSKRWMMTGYARIDVSTNAIYVRFEKVGSRQKFNALMDRFNERFQLKEWDETRRAWLLPPGDYNQVIQFCKATFGLTGFQVNRSISQ